MLQQQIPDDFVIATGTQYSVREFTNLAAKKLGLDLEWKGSGLDEYAVDGTGRRLVAIDKRYFRPTEVDSLVGDPTKAKLKLGWQAKTTFNELVEEMVSHDLREAERDALVKSHGHRINNPRE